MTSFLSGPSAESNVQSGPPAHPEGNVQFGPPAHPEGDVQSGPAHPEGDVQSGPGLLLIPKATFNNFLRNINRISTFQRLHGKQYRSF